LASWSRRSPSSPRPWTRNAGRDQVLDLAGDPVAAFELDGVGARLLQEPAGGGQRVLAGALVGTERQVGHDHGPAGAADHRRGQRDEVIDGHRDRGVVPEHDHAGRVADEQHRDPGLVEDVGGERVVGGEHRPLLTAGLGGRDVADGDPSPGLAAVQRLWGWLAGPLSGSGQA
jgi:hypothetical protein